MMKRRSLILSLSLTAWVGVTAVLSYGAVVYRSDIKEGWNASRTYAADIKDKALSSADQAAAGALETFENAAASIVSFKDNAVSSVRGGVESAVDSVVAFGHSLMPQQENRYSIAHERRRAGIINAAYDISSPPPPLTLSEIKRRNQEKIQADYSSIEPAAGPVWTPDQPSVTAEAVLVPRQVTVISSSQDGRIAEIPVSHGDTFKKGDLLIAYDCTDVEAEAEIAKIQKDLTKRRADGTNKLFKLDIISDIDRLGAEVEDKQAGAKARVYEARMQDCQIRARFDGRVTNRLANPGEYTRTDRVLLEVASNEPLQAEFLIPSKWLRWVNVGAPVSISIGETDKTYKAHIRSIHGEVDPVSQSIQMIAVLDSYDDPLLPGMSGQVTIDVDSVRSAGIKGYLEAGYTPQR